MQANGVLMGCIRLQPRVIEALLSAGATEKIIADAQQILDACITCIGRPRKYKDRAERDRAYRERKKKARVETRPIIPSLKELLVEAAAHNVDLSAGEGPIRYLIDIGCDLEADILPTVARTLPEPREAPGKHGDGNPLVPFRLRSYSMIRSGRSRGRRRLPR